MTFAIQPNKIYVIAFGFRVFRAEIGGRDDGVQRGATAHRRRETSRGDAVFPGKFDGKQFRSNLISRRGKLHVRQFARSKSKTAYSQ